MPSQYLSLNQDDCYLPICR